MNNPYIPQKAKIIKITDEVSGSRAIKTFTCEFLNKEDCFDYLPGQCVMVSLLGYGESFFAISSSPTQQGIVEVSVMKLGKVTNELHDKSEGDIIAIRGPYGNGFPVKDWVGKNILCIGGGVGQAPLRSLIKYVLDNQTDYKQLSIFYGARSGSTIGFKDEMAQMKEMPGVDVYLSIDNAEPGWDDYVGFVPDNVDRVKPSPENTIAVTCGPPIMIEFVIRKLNSLGFKDEDIFTTLEMRMKCGIGKCGRCNVGPHYVCKDGPVFSNQVLKNLKCDM